MSGENDQTDGTQAAETEAEDTGSTEELSPEAEAEAEAQAAWEEFTGNKPEDSGDGEGEGESSSDANDGAASAEDIWANAPSELRAAFDAEKSRASRAEQEAVASRGRISSLQTHLDTLTGAAPEQGDKAGAAETSSEAEDSQDSPFETEKWKTLRDEFGDIVEPIEEVLSPLVAELRDVKAENRRLREGMQTIGEDRLYSRAQQAEEQVREVHPDLDDALTSDEFTAWAKAAPAYIQQGIQRNAKAIVDAAEATDIVARFKADTGYGSNGGEGDGSGSSTGQDANGAAANGKDGDGEEDASRGRAYEADDQVEYGRLAGPVGTEQADHLAAAHGE